MRSQLLWRAVVQPLREAWTPIGNLLRHEGQGAGGSAAVGRVSDGGRRVLAYEQRLPTGLPPPEDEFKREDSQPINLAQPLVSSIVSQRVARISLSMYESIELRTTVNGLALSVLAVYGIGAAESLACLSSELCAESPLQAARFAHWYALEQVLPSTICMPAKPSSAVALSLGLEPSAALAAPFRSAGAMPYDFNYVCDAADANLILRQQGLAAARCSLATLSLLTMILRTVSLSIATAQEFKERVRDGHEPLFRGVSQRVIRLCGRTSDTTALSLARYGPHIVPIYERADDVRDLVYEHSHGFRRPVYWQVSACARRSRGMPSP